MKIVLFQTKFCCIAYTENISESKFGKILESVNKFPSFLKKIAHFFLFHPSYDIDSFIVGKRSIMNAFIGMGKTCFAVENFLFVLKNFDNISQQDIETFLLHTDEEQLKKLFQNSEIHTLDKYNTIIFEKLNFLGHLRVIKNYEDILTINKLVKF